MLSPEPNICIRSQMEHEIARHDTRFQMREIEQIALNELKPGIRTRILQKSATAGGEIVVSRHVMTQSKQAVYQVASNKSGTAGYKTFQ